MRWLISGMTGLLLAAGVLLWLPLRMEARAGESNPGSPPIAQKLVREGDLAVRLQAALVGTAGDEATAESRLAELGITPKNGWIADYPVTPDIADEIYKSVHDAAENGTLPLSSETALERLNTVMAEAGISSNATATGGGTVLEPSETTGYPDSTDLNDYYDTEGPPVVTYYTPPPDYYSMYGWVPYPFWCDGFRFSGYFILHDFHRIDVDHDRHRFISNHFRDVRTDRVTRIDPITRFEGGHPRGAGVATGNGFGAVNAPNRIRSIPGWYRTPAPATVTRGASPGVGVNRMGTPLPRGERSGFTGGAGRATVNAPSSGSFARPSPSGRWGGSSYHGSGMGGTAGGSAATFSAPRTTFSAPRSFATFGSHFSDGGFGGRGRR